jgi:hypothetical protein
MSNEKNGKMPISSKGEMDTLASYRDGSNINGSILDVDPVLKSFLEKEGFACRWLNATRYKSDGGFNKNGWRALRMDSVPEKIRDSVGLTFGTSGDGFLTRNDLVLGIRTIEKHEAHKKQLKSRAESLTGDSKFDERKEQLKDALGRAGSVQTGYED